MSRGRADPMCPKTMWTRSASEKQSHGHIGYVVRLYNTHQVRDLLVARLGIGQMVKSCDSQCIVTLKRTRCDACPSLFRHLVSCLAHGRMGEEVGKVFA